MLIIPVIFLCLFAFGLVFVNRRGGIYKEISINLSEEELSENFKKLSKRLGIPKKQGVGVEIKPLEKEIKSANRIIKRKVNGGDIERFEKIFYDNFYLFENYFKSKPDELFSLPHQNNVPRVVILSRALIAMTKGNVTKDNFRRGIYSFLEYTELTFMETEKLLDAIKFALIEKVCEIANTIKSLNKLRKISTHISFISRGFKDSNLYVYFVKKYNPNLYFKLRKYIDLSDRAKNPDEVFNNLSINLEELLKNIVNSLLNIEESVNGAYKMLPQYKVLNTLSSFSLSNEEEQKEYLKEVGKISDSKNILESECAKNLIEKWGDGLPIILFQKEELLARVKNLLKEIGVYFLSFLILPFEIIFNLVILIKTIFSMNRIKKVNK